MTEPGHVVTRRQQQKLETRQAILFAARRLFEKQGYEGTTVRGVAAEAKVALGTIFVHFPDKESLFLASLIDGLEEVQRRSWASMPSDAPIQVKLLHLAREGLAGWAQRPAVAKVLSQQMYFTNGPDRDRIRALDEGAIERMVALLEEAQRGGEIRSDVDLFIAARTLFSYYLTTVLDWAARVDGSTVDSRSMLEQKLAETRRFLEQLFRGIGVPEEES